jgi:hypothetical protein
MEIEEPVPTFDSFEEGPALSFDLDSSEPLDLDLGSGFAQPAPAAPAPPPPAPRLRSAVEKAAVDLDQEEGGEDLDFITEHITEAEVFAKYGLAEKQRALRAIIERAPKHLAAHEKLYRILLEEADVSGARARPVSTSAFCRRRATYRRSKACATIRHARPSLEFRRPAPARPAPPTMERASHSRRSAEELSFDLDSDAPEFSIPAGKRASSRSMLLSRSRHSKCRRTTPPSKCRRSSPSRSANASPVEEFLRFDAQPGSPLFEPPSFDNAPSAEELRELDFYIEQELFDEAREKLAALSSGFPGDASVDERRTRFEAASMPAAKPPADAYAPPVLSRDEIESELLFALPDDDDDFVPAPPPPPPPPRAAAPPPVTPVHEENLFADEDDFFDLAAELESELEEESEEVSLSEEEQSLEEISRNSKGCRAAARFRGLRHALQPRHRQQRDGSDR